MKPNAKNLVRSGVANHYSESFEELGDERRTFPQRNRDKETWKEFVKKRNERLRSLRSKKPTGE